MDEVPPLIPTGQESRHKKTRRKCAKLSTGKKISGTVLLSHSQIYSTIAAGALNYRVREGNVCFCSAISTGKKSNLKKCLYWRKFCVRSTTLIVLRATFFGSLRLLAERSKKRWLSLTAD